MGDVTQIEVQRSSDTTDWIVEVLSIHWLQIDCISDIPRQGLALCSVQSVDGNYSKLPMAQMFSREIPQYPGH